MLFPKQRKAVNVIGNALGKAMIIYKRNIEKKLLVLRLVFLLLLILLSFSFIINYHNLGYFLIVIFLGLSTIVIKDFRVYSNSITISKYYLFGLINKNWKLHEESIVGAFSMDSDFGAHTEYPQFDFNQHEAGCLMSLFSIFMPSRIVAKEFKIEVTDKLGLRSSSVYVLLNEREYNYLKKFLA